MKKAFIIAEAGVNHNGNLDLAKKLVDAAVEAGVDAVKFQSFKTENLVNKNAEKAEYQKKSTSSEESQYGMLKKLELDEKEHRILKEYCKNKNIMFLSTAFDLDSIELLNSMGINIFKIPSGEITNYPYLRKIGLLKKKVILSTGMSNLEEVRNAIDVLNRYGTTDICVLHCNTEYPTPMEDVNLKAMLTIKRELGVDVGYSDHTIGIEIPIAAVAIGASVIEKHFTLDKNMEGPDHKASLEPDELKEMVRCIRNIEKSFGNGIKIISNSEKKNISIVRKSIVASRKIKKGEEFTEENITCKRPGYGVNPMKWNEVIGTNAIRNFEEDELIEI